MSMRGKIKSFTMVNWNGFFARTFEMDALVTTLSGGNGAGKSTSMAALITALIPDQSLLHFRNTTEAGSSSASRDKGLYGKLKRGHCYALLDVVNSREQRIWVGVHLEQVANRDNKVNITPFAMLDVPAEVAPTDLLLERLDDGKAKVRAFADLRKAAAELGALKVAKFNSVTDYHNFMFEYGITPKKLRDQKDRARFYRLIEASLYGGISSSISRSLREYLLPENSGVRKAFQDMEAAIYENRRTLDAIRETQGQRDLFRNLITETTHYVAADYVRNSAEKSRLSEGALHWRRQLQDKHRLVREEKQRAIYLADEVEQMSARETQLTDELEVASEHLAKVINAVALNGKIAQYVEDVTDLSQRLEEQLAIGEEIAEQKAELEGRKGQADAEVDSLKSQLADYQQALDVQQTRAIQYRQARQALQAARELCNLPQLEPETLGHFQQQAKHQEQAQTEALLALQQRFNLARAAADQYESALALLTGIAGPVARSEAWSQSQALLKQADEARQLQARGQAIVRALQEAERNQQQRSRLQAEVSELSQALGQPLASEADLALAIELTQAAQEDVQGRLREAAESRIGVQQRLQPTQERIETLRKLAPAYLIAQEKLDKLRELCGEALENPQAVSQAMHKTLEAERATEASKNKLHERKLSLESQIRRLQNVGGAADEGLLRIAEQLHGTLLSDVYDDISLEDAPYYSALYGPARNAIVVADLDAAVTTLGGLDDLPEDIYLIQGNPDAFDEDLLEASERGQALVVRASDRQLRYSRFPHQPQFGRAAREQRIAALESEREALIEEHAKLAFEQQKRSRTYHHFSQFIAEHQNVAFLPDPEEELAIKQAQLREWQGQLEQAQQQQGQLQAALQQQGQRLTRLQRLEPQWHLLAQGDLDEQLAQLRAQQAQLDEAQQWLARHGAALLKLAEQQHLLKEDPQGIEALQEQLQQAEQQLSLLRRQSFALDELQGRVPHLAYADAESMLGETSQISERLKEKLAQAELTRRQAAEQHQQIQGRFTEAMQVKTALQSSFEAKRQTLEEFRQELSAMGLQVAADMEEKAREHKRQVEEQLVRTRTRRTQAEAQFQVCRRDIDSLSQRLLLEGKDYRTARKALIQHKVNWNEVVRLARDNDVEKRLNRRELAYLDGDELRSISDKALGALRLAVAHDEELRDTLRLSEGNRNTAQKVAFYVTVYRYLKERIRHDIIRSDDPVEAIEEMEIELSRLAEELKQRETHLSLSSTEVAAKINNIIRREQNRIRVLNQGLQNIAFGQVHGVRLNVNVREAYGRLLSALGEQATLHQDLFADNQMSFSEAMAKLFGRLNPHIDQGERSYQVLGEALLDYRNYLELEIEVQRGVDGWLRAESGALSTGEAIGTGQAILLMVLQSWEEDAKRLRAKEMQPCRLLFLDEAARLDAKSIATLFELCERQDMQLLIAAPENISPEKGTTYKLIRKVHGQHEQVHVVGLRGFGYASGDEVRLNA
ncbi:chromosome partition protein MukB [Pseudaeromonas sp. ZJS20]|uniref:chromosome partition protein MukB n=1 Tax=Pseudaeromonas aegiceratis TaxID=3153928 RepID=UPI00390CCFCD